MVTSLYSASNDEPVLAVVYSCPPENEGLFKPIAQFFGIWHQILRGQHRGMHEVRWQRTGAHVLLINDKQARHYVELLPNSYSIVPFSTSDFRSAGVAINPKGAEPPASLVRSLITVRGVGGPVVTRAGAARASARSACETVQPDPTRPTDRTNQPTRAHLFRARR